MGRDSQRGRSSLCLIPPAAVDNAKGALQSYNTHKPRGASSLKSETRNTQGTEMEGGGGERTGVHSRFSLDKGGAVLKS